MEPPSRRPPPRELGAATREPYPFPLLPTGRRRGVRWYGVLSFWGHIQHFLASAIATNDIDARDWMTPDEPDELARRVLERLGGDPRAPTLVDGLARDVWIDFLADTGDDPVVAEAVGSLLCREYVAGDPTDPSVRVALPRGDVLLVGGDMAYPVATTDEIHDRLVVPFNRSLIAVADGRPRVVLGVPGNHDWYDGLDGFARLVRRRAVDLSPDEDRPSVVSGARPGRGVRRAAEWAERFVQGKSVSQRKALVLEGYTPVQGASYLALPLAPGLTLIGVDRQLRSIDFRQRRYFQRVLDARADDHLVVLLPDPVFSFLDPSPTGVAMADALGLALAERPHLVVSGDLHHYERLEVGATTHVIAGGGGAFLHGARLARQGVAVRPTVEWPDEAQTRALLARVPLHVALGRAGLIPHLVMTLFFAPTLGIGLTFWGTRGSVEGATAVAAAFAAIVCALIGGWRRGRFVKVAALALATGVVVGLVPTATARVVAWGLARAGVTLGPGALAGVVLLLAAFVGAFAFGAYLVALAATGLESTQALTALGHRGFKHFVRLRVRADGAGVDAWVIGVVDPLDPRATPALVDSFAWRAPRPAQSASDRR